MNQRRFWLVLLLMLPLTFPTIAQDDDDDEEKVEGTEVVVEQVVTASRRPEKRLEAPSTIETVTATELARSPATAFSGALAQVKGLDFANAGINLQKISTRGFSSSFNSRMLLLVDGRLSTLPGAGLPQGGLSSVSPLDIKSMELVLGPAGALYGSNTTAGLLNVITKTPWDEEGLSVALKGGEQDLVDAKIRYAWLDESRRWGFKLTGQYLDAEDFDSENFYDFAGQNQTSYASEADLQAAVDAGTAFPEQALVDDFGVTSSKYELHGYYQSDYALFELNYNWSENDNFGVTNLGRNRILGWEIEELQAKVSAPHWYARVTRTEEGAGDTYSIQNVPGLLAAGLSLEQAIDGSRFINDSTLTDAEFQANYTFGDLDVIAGINYREYEPSSDGSFLDDIPTADGSVNDISRDETGLYIQFDYRTLDDKLRFVAAGRYDDFSEFDAQFSPKLGVTYQHGNHNFRANFITSYRAPEIIETHLFFFGGIARGNLNGWEVVDSTDPAVAQTIATIAPLDVEEVETFELGYRGILSDNLFMEAIAYTSTYDNFISPLSLIANGVNSFVRVPQEDAIAPGVIIPAFFFTYLNYGSADINGWDLGLDWYFSDGSSIKGSIGYATLDSFTNNTAIPDLPFNTPELKYKLQVDVQDFLVENGFFNAGARRVNAYEYLSGRWNALLAETFILDAAVGYVMPEEDLFFKLSMSNLTNQDKTELLGAPTTPQFITFEVSKKF